MNDEELLKLWENTEIPEVDALWAKLEADAEAHDYELSYGLITKMLFQSFKAGFEFANKQ